MSQSQIRNVVTNLSDLGSYGVTPTEMRSGALVLVRKKMNQYGNVTGWFVNFKVKQGETDLELRFAIDESLTGVLIPWRFMPVQDVFTWTDGKKYGPAGDQTSQQETMEVLIVRLTHLRIWGSTQVYTPASATTGVFNWGFYKRGPNPASLTIHATRNPGEYSERAAAFIAQLKGAVKQQLPGARDVRKFMKFSLGLVPQLNEKGIEFHCLIMNQFVASWQKRRNTLAWYSILAGQGYPISDTLNATQKYEAFVGSEAGKRLHSANKTKGGGLPVKTEAQKSGRSATEKKKAKRERQKLNRDLKGKGKSPLVLEGEFDSEYESAPEDFSSFVKRKVQEQAPSKEGVVKTVSFVKEKVENAATKVVEMVVPKPDKGKAPVRPRDEPKETFWSKYGQKVNKWLDYTTYYNTFWSPFKEEETETTWVDAVLGFVCMPFVSLQIGVTKIATKLFSLISGKVKGKPVGRWKLLMATAEEIAMLPARVVCTTLTTWVAIFLS
jgi:hypothetical protein